MVRKYSKVDHFFPLQSKIYMSVEEEEKKI